MTMTTHQAAPLEALLSEFMRHDADETSPTIQALTAAIDLMKERRYAKAWSARGPRGELSLLGWQDMSTYEEATKLLHLREGWRFVFAYEVAAAPTEASR